ncbi:efflux RND transporter periplasmic adaptor subunit [Paenibacillus elgii]|uniref:efflux RND transporter periplasmic adaptor subunit n=1 Tax=Paenibacillus elgii TaxID=189691 RepID=UPI000248CC48|nr:efflux RND transporter periplasmic adaptor subunit [Paenibacillus elgii]
MKKRTWFAAAGAVLVIGITGLLYWQSRPQNASRPAVSQTTNALKFKAVREDLTNIVEVKGKSSYQKETYINAPFGAYVAAWSVKDGSQVAKGDVLFRLDDTELRNEIAQLQANAKKQEMDIRLNQFQEKTGIADADTEGITETDAKKRFAAAESRKMQNEITQVNLEHTRTQLAEKTKKLQGAGFAAPENGIFLFEGTKEPKSVKDNERIGKIVDLTKLQLICNVGEYDLFRIKEGMDVEVRVDALKDVKLKGKVERLSKFAKAGTGSSSESSNTTAAQFEVTISLEPNERLIAGLSLTASIQTDKKSGALVVPTLTIQRDKDDYYVMVEAADGSLEKRIVKIGLETPEKTEVLSGLNEGESVVLQ